MRFIGLDVHRDFCEVAIAEGGEVRLAGRVQTEPAALELFAQSLGGDDEVALEATGNALGIARIIEPHVGRVVLANPKAVKGITRAGAKTDKIDARTLAKLLAGGFLPAVWLPDEQTRILRRRISARAQLVRQRTRAKNQVHATLIRNLKGKPPVSDLFGVRGRRWLAAQELPGRRAGDGRGLPAPDRVPRRRDRPDRAGARRAGARLDRDAAAADAARRQLRHRRGAARRDRRHRPLPDRRGSWSATSASTRASASPAPSRPGTDGSASRARARHGTCWSRRPGTPARTPGPLRAFHQRIAARRGGNIATVAVARKLAVIAWHMLSRGEDYAFARPSLTREKIRRLELMTGAERQKGKRIGVWATKEQHRLDKELAAQAELAYRRLVQDWQPPGSKGTGAAPGRASRRPSSGQAARQETAPPPAL